ncbi:MULTISPECIES: hypothetical protein [Tenebrionibacter/Tenebrionicola group]|jgi:hypothetical protein|uniref:DUF3102 domain-containing protein n=2 Tax=Tenebrionibacter/Tenebrionicola group TaxID=2969848 RepID=A0A8K0UZW1_9ENTR|nr:MULTISPECIES: hypothetical protein [Tenebrionibacter/Tenebrionicola group]MBK4714594.1 hypothetical protein [Tenebrionibacter intestinalis]MBV5095048.1 hypothetical protein [Tenebrionicola larvae]
MARKKSPTPNLLPDVTLNPKLEATQNLMTTVSSQMNDERDLLNQLLGQAQMADAFEQFSRTVRTSKLAFVKENKLYRNLKGKKAPNGSEFSGTWDEFCNVLGISVDKADLDIANLTAFGEEALESMSRMGIGYRELRQFRRLPDDQKSALIEVAKEGDKAAFVELAEELISKHEKEKADLQTDLEINRQSLAEQKAKVHRLIDEKTELEDKFRVRVQRETPEEKIVHIKQEIAGLQVGAFSALMSINNGFSTLADDTETSGIVHAGYMAGILDDIQERIMHLRDRFNLPGYREIGPDDWIRDEIEHMNADHSRQDS